MQNLKYKTLRGGLAKLGAQVVNLALRLGSIVVLARLLNPMDFGLVAMVTAVLGILNLLRDFGISTAIIQKTDVSDQQVSTLFWVNVAIGCILTSISLGFAPIIAEIYHEPRLVGIAGALAFTFPIFALGNQHSALLQRKLRYTTLALIDTGSIALSVTVAIGLGYAGYGYWALVAMALSGPSAYSILAWIASAWVPKLPRRGTGIRQMMRFGSIVTMNTVVVYIAYNLEKLLLGRFWGAEALGVYGRAYQLANIPTESLNSAVGEVTFSTLSRIKDDEPRLRNYFLKGYTLVVSLTLPIAITCALYSNDLVLVILGAKWSDAGPIFLALAPTIIVYALINPLGWLLFALGRIGRSLKMSIALAPVVISGYLLGIPFGPVGVALGYSSAMAIWIIPHIAWAISGTTISGSDILRAIGKPFISSLISAVLAVGLNVLLLQAYSSVSRLAIGMCFVFATYILILFYVMGQREFYLDLIRTVTRGSMRQQ